MAEFLNGYKRDRMCGEFRSSDIGKEVICYGFVAKFRNLGNLIFIDVRDRSGIVQVRFDDTTTKEIFDKACGIKNEFVVCCKGKVISRGDNINTKIPTGEIEIVANDLKILAEAEVLPFVISDEAKVGDSLRLKYRYLDLRRPSLQEKIVMRDKISRISRNYLADNGFLEIDTPFLGKSTPEGARDYLVPSRVHPGEFYALPQSPQIFKQLLMISGFDRYYQVARCFRDEDLRANRQPEFSQIDMEMSFVEQPEEVMEVAEGLIKKIFTDCKGMTFDKAFDKMTYADAMQNYGSDKPDLRFGMKIVDISNIVKDSAFSVFSGAIANGGSVRAINAKGLANLTRKEVTALTDFIKDFGAKGLAYIMLKEDGETSSFLKNISEQEKLEMYKALNAETNDLLLFVADTNKIVFNSLGALRCHIAEKFNLIDPNDYKFLWVVDFPLLEYDDEEKRYVAVHHPFTSAKQEDMQYIDTDPGKIRANAYDLVINGEEAGGGSIRIHTVEMQKKMFELLGMSEQDIADRFGFFVDAFKYGAPPHGGLAFGLDRLVMLVTNTENIRDVIPFPKIQNAKCLMTDAPNVVELKQLKELHLDIKE